MSGNLPLFNDIFFSFYIKMRAYSINADMQFYQFFSVSYNNIKQVHIHIAWHDLKQYFI